MNENRPKKNIGSSYLIINSVLSFLLLVGALILWKYIKPDEFSFKTDIQGDPGESFSEVCFIDVGQGDSALITSSDGKKILIDCGTAESGTTISNYLKRTGTEGLDLLVLTHPHSDHIGSAARIIKEFSPELVLITGRNSNMPEFDAVKKSIAETNKVKCETAVSGKSYHLGEIVITALHSAALYDEASEEMNNESMVVLIELSGKKLLFMGDAEQELEKKLLLLPEGSLDADIIKLGHHGSDTSSSEELLKAASPEFAVISVSSENEFGHPSEAVTERLDSLGIDYYRTDLDGSVKFTFSEKGFAVYTSKLRAARKAAVTG